VSSEGFLSIRKAAREKGSLMKGWNFIASVGTAYWGGLTYGSIISFRTYQRVQNYLEKTTHAKKKNQPTIKPKHNSS